MLTYWEFTGNVFANIVYMKNGTTQDSILTESVTEASYGQFKHRTSHVPNLIPSVKYMKRLTFESIKSNTSNLGRTTN